MKTKPLAYEAYQTLADEYAARVDTKPHNAYCERPAMLAMWPDLAGKRVLDAGCGPGVYAEALLARGASVTSFDASDHMIEHARERLGPDADIRQIDMSQPLAMFDNGQFDFVNAPLCFDYVEDWHTLFAEMRRVLKPGGALQFSFGHPSFDADYFKTNDYYSVEQVTCTWKGFGQKIVMPSFRRSFTEAIEPLTANGFCIEKFVEPQPTEDFRKADLRRYNIIMHRPCFLCIQARKLAV